MALRDLLTYVAETLDRAGIDYMITGSIASILQGRPAGGTTSTRWSRYVWPGGPEPSAEQDAGGRPVMWF